MFDAHNLLKAHTHQIKCECTHSPDQVQAHRLSQTSGSWPSVARHLVNLYAGLQHVLHCKYSSLTAVHTHSSDALCLATLFQSHSDVSACWSHDKPSLCCNGNRLMVQSVCNQPRQPFRVSPCRSGSSWFWSDSWARWIFRLWIWASHIQQSSPSGGHSQAIGLA